MLHLLLMSRHLWVDSLAAEPNALVVATLMVTLENLFATQNRLPRNTQQTDYSVDTAVYTCSFSEAVSIGCHSEIVANSRCSKPPASSL